VYCGFPHGMPVSHAETINDDLLAFIKTGGVVLNPSHVVA
jgi:hypothetical protein